ncbi:D-cysteine desulfhydrase family protein [Pseudemcibacter aquimaris]|uniref:D-cysteine desulfhydrase family protein n=1 Tax=Pseudemcibacter aquimaris TaxID=2857064 RepID=UPI002013B388|nr:D-cysteine desulfhydrase family protein [Pseudemcibacter aquimaris]MCC3859693.1 D-cysteine desulfhydrase family protein [Pseudemcibacter aquimaris]WDU60088.1 D-cysteine desulfhydrase family protein [Pseudemcibacter aquimaris]
MKQNRRDMLKTAGLATLAATTFSAKAFAETSKNFNQIPRIKLTTLPTACNKMENLTQLMGGPDLYIKRDDVMELAHGGNKTRKLEFSLAEAVKNGAKAVVTQGGLQSNHVRQTVSGAKKIGLEVHVILSNPVPEMEDRLKDSGNYLMDRLMGAHIHLAGAEGRGPVVEKVIADLTAQGKNPYNIPSGASNAIGSMGYVDAARELISQWNEMGISPSHIFTATGSCGTAAGLLTGLRYFGNRTTKVIAISVAAPAAPLKNRIRQIVDEGCEMLGTPGLVKDDEIIVEDKYYGQAYGYPTDAGIAALKMIAESEGIILDPVYTSKGMSGMIDMLRMERLENARDLVFLHTGGAPAIHPYRDYFNA